MQRLNGSIAGAADCGIDGVVCDGVMGKAWVLAGMLLVVLVAAALGPVVVWKLTSRASSKSVVWLSLGAMGDLVVASGSGMCWAAVACRCGAASVLLLSWWSAVLLLVLL